MDIQQRLDAIFTSDEYRKVAEAIKSDFILSKSLLDEQGELKTKDWTPVQEPVQILGKPWKVFVYRFATKTDALPSPVFLTFARLAPPDGMKLALESLAKDDPSWQSAVQEYSSAATSPDADRVKTELMQMFETLIYPGKGFHFVPDPQCYGMLPHFDFDLVIPFISLPSLVANQA